MVRAKLHMICGNCGSDDMFEYNSRYENNSETGRPEIKVSIYCKNCGTIHCLEDNADHYLENK